MLIKEFLMHLYGRRIGVFVAIMFSLVVTGCDAATPENCETNETGGGCTITAGSHAGFEIEMTKAAAFENACKRANVGKLKGHPAFYTNGKRKGYPKTSICSLEQEALAAERWLFTERAGFRERYVTLEFENSDLERIILELRGWDP